MATLADLQARLAAINDKISKTETAQRYGTSGFNIDRGQLDLLYKERDSIEMRLARMQGQTSTYAMFGSRS